MFGPTGDSVAQSEILHPSNPSATIDVDVRGANRIYLVAESTRLPDAQPVKESGQLLANWVNPQFQLQDQSTSEVSQWNWLYATRKGKSDVPRIGVNANRQPVKVAEGVVSNNIGVTTKSVIAFDLQGQAVQRFRSEVRFDQNNTAKAHGVRFSVKLDRTPSAETIARPQQLELGNANAAHGRALFFSDKLACARCHMIQGYGGEIGPDLTQIAAKHATPVLMESILRPSAAISVGFETMDVATVDGKLFSGLLISNGDPLVLKDAQGKYSSISRDDIDAQQQAQASLMPEMKGLLTVQETRDLVAFLKQVAKVQ